MEHCGQTFNSPSTSSGMRRTENVLSSSTSEKPACSEVKTYFDISMSFPTVWEGMERTYSQPVNPLHEVIDLSQPRHQNHSACHFSHPSKDVKVKARSNGRSSTAPYQAQHRVAPISQQQQCNATLHRQTISMPIFNESTTYKMQHEYTEPQTQYNQNAFHVLENPHHHHPQINNSWQPQLNPNPPPATYCQESLLGNTVPSASNLCSTSSMSSNESVANSFSSPKATTTLKNPNYLAKCHAESDATIQTVSDTNDNTFKVSLPGGQTLFSVPLLPTKGNLWSNSSTLNYSEVNKKSLTRTKKTQKMHILDQNKHNKFAPIRNKIRPVKNTNFTNDRNNFPNFVHPNILTMNNDIARTHFHQPSYCHKVVLPEVPSNFNPNKFYNTNGIETAMSNSEILVDERCLNDTMSASDGTHTATEVNPPNTLENTEEVLRRGQAAVNSLNAITGRLLNKSYFDEPILQTASCWREKHGNAGNESTGNKESRPASPYVHNMVLQIKTTCKEVDASVPPIETEKDACFKQGNRWTEGNESAFPVTSFANVSSTYQSSSLDMPDISNFNTNLTTVDSYTFGSSEKISKTNGNTRAQKLTKNSSRSLRDRSLNDLSIIYESDELEIEDDTSAVDQCISYSMESHKTMKQVPKILENVSISSQLINGESDVEMGVESASKALQTHSSASSQLSREEISSRSSGVRIPTECNVQVDEMQTLSSILPDSNNPLYYESSYLSPCSDSEGELLIDESVVDSNEFTPDENSSSQNNNGNEFT
ncbi:unnamed protein product [Orchesella dallaii]|uniref:Uncharacterized protein n=1 Tax=Orchesella dallaii TaxID=48710 RepID=A0ABP1QBV2_9HEXA